MRISLTFPFFNMQFRVKACTTWPASAQAIYLQCRTFQVQKNCQLFYFLPYNQIGWTKWLDDLLTLYFPSSAEEWSRKKSKTPCLHQVILVISANLELSFIWFFKFSIVNVSRLNSFPYSYDHIWYLSWATPRRTFLPS